MRPSALCILELNKTSELYEFLSQVQPQTVCNLERDETNEC